MTGSPGARNATVLALAALAATALAAPADAGAPAGRATLAVGATATAAPGACPDSPGRMVVGAPDHRNDPTSPDDLFSMGAVEVRDDGGAQLLTPHSVAERDGEGEGEATRYDYFGAAVSRIDLGTGTCQVLVAGAPASYGFPGRVFVVFDGPGGFASGTRTLVLTAPVPQLHEGFGAALAVTPRKPAVAGVTDVDLWVGAPGRDIDGKGNAGAIERFRLTYDTHTAAPELAVTHLQTITQDSAGIPDTAETDDRFGRVLEPALAGLDDRWGLLVGTPLEDVTTAAGTARDAGMVTALTVAADGTAKGRMSARGVTQASPGVAGAVEAADEFGSAVVDRLVGGDRPRQVITVGAPGENVGVIKDAGAVQDTEGLSLGQGVSGLSDRPERMDRFGASLAWVQPPRPCTECAQPAPVLVVGVPKEDIGTVRDAGAVQFGSTLLWQGKGFGGSAETGDLLGETMTTQPDSSVLVGSPSEDLAGLYNAGQVHLVPSTATAAALIATPAQPFTLVTGPAGRARYGSVLGR